MRDSEVDVIDDITSPSGALYTEGCGLISPQLASDLLAQKMAGEEDNVESETEVPGALQIRYKFFKGTVVVDTTLQGRKVWHQSRNRPQEGSPFPFLLPPKSKRYGGKKLVRQQYAGRSYVAGIRKQGG